MCFSLVCRITLSITGPARSITPDVMGLPVRSIIPDVMVSAPIITLAAFTTYINYVYLRCIAVKDRFRVCLKLILPLVDPESMA